MRRGGGSPFRIAHREADLVSACAERVSFHPNINTVTVTLARPDFERFLADCGNVVTFVRV